ncbi:hybrid sensor histidine kinase/response regulator [Caballeronia sordidicola]|uniref:histidine kinase n=1 Tax=Caballeronia sordidicola TaxID=196367 RepID=A0A242MSG1_CABSO|nr:hybrid sensor histidine kinase/response regulator [Caballeronia sordidicola]OTP74307.1 PAS/PAC protein [Caballeronia sordidicola]
MRDFAFQADPAAAPRSFSSTRYILLFVLAISFLVPSAFLFAYGFYDYQRRISEANDIVDRIAQVAEEQALKVLDLNGEISGRIVDMLGDGDDLTIRDSEDTIHKSLIVIGGAFPQVAGISVFGVKGDLLATSRYFPAPPVSIRDRDDFKQAEAIRPEVYFSLPLRGKVAQTDVFTTSIGRSGYDGKFLGVVSIALRREYFNSFYRALTNDAAAVNVALYRKDGGILVRYPDTQPAAAAAASNTAFTQALKNNELYGHLQMTSSVDKLERIVAFRRVGDYPIYVVSGISSAAIASQWRDHLVFITLITALPSAGIWLLVMFSLRQLKAEKTAWDKWQMETSRRESAEASTRQLQRVSALSNLVASIAHEFNNLLMVVSTNSALARKKEFMNVEKEVVAVERAGVGAESLARRLMSVARKQPLKLESIDLFSWLSSAKSLVATALGERVRVSIEVSPNVWPIFVDKTELESAVINIAMNAKDALPDGGRFVIRCQNSQLPARNDLLPAGDYISIACTDNGSGMSDDVLSRAFEPLFTTKAQGARLGLGLAQVLSATEQAGGTARVDSIRGKGTTVRLYFPRHLVQPVAVKETAAVVPLPTLRMSTSVLLVEDNEEVAAGVSAVLEMMGCKVRHEVTADRAMDLLNTGATFDLILSDIQMPGAMNGIDLAEHVLKTWPSENVTLMTGYADEIERATHAGVKILAKPFDLAELEKLVAESRSDQVT